VVLPPESCRGQAFRFLDGALGYLSPLARATTNDEVCELTSLLGGRLIRIERDTVRVVRVWRIRFGRTYLVFECHDGCKLPYAFESRELLYALQRRHWPVVTEPRLTYREVRATPICKLGDRPPPPDNYDPPSPRP
jgi:hypothetical protein